MTSIIPNKYGPHQRNNVTKTLFFDRETKKILLKKKKQGSGDGFAH